MALLTFYDISKDWYEKLKFSTVIEWKSFAAREKHNCFTFDYLLKLCPDNRVTIVLVVTYMTHVWYSTVNDNDCDRTTDAHTYRTIDHGPCRHGKERVKDFLNDKPFITVSSSHIFFHLQLILRWPVAASKSCRPTT